MRSHRNERAFIRRRGLNNHFIGPSRFDSAGNSRACEGFCDIGEIILAAL